MNAEPQRPALRYFGGKWRLAPWIISHFPDHRVYVEPFGGAASVLLRKKRAYAEVYNDLDDILVTVFRVLQDPVTALELERKLRLTPFARAEFARAEFARAYEVAHDPVEHARRTIIRSFMGFGSDGVHSLSTGFRANSNRSGTTPAHDWVNYWDRVPEFTQRLAGVVIENKDATEVMKTHDSATTLFYVDPPYVHETRNVQHGYGHEMNDSQHRDLIEELKQLKGFVILSGYEHPIYESLGWEKKSIAALADGARARTEVLWLNPAAQSAQSQMSLNL